MFLTIQISILTFVSLNTRVTGNQILTFKWKSQIHILRHYCFIFWIDCAMNLGRDTLGREGSWDTLGREGYSRCILKIREKKAAFVGRIWRTLGIGTALGASLWRNRRRRILRMQPSKDASYELGHSHGLQNRSWGEMKGMMLEKQSWFG